MSDDPTGGFDLAAARAAYRAHGPGKAGGVRPRCFFLPERAVPALWASGLCLAAGLFLLAASELVDGWLDIGDPALPSPATAACAVGVPLVLWLAVRALGASWLDPLRRGGRLWLAVVVGAVLVVAVQNLLELVHDAVPPPAIQPESGPAQPARQPANIEVLPGGAEIAFHGVMEHGLTAQIAAALDQQPTITVVHMHSNGGRVREGLLLQRLVRDRGLTVHVPQRCYSACAIAFVGGRERLVAPRARLGFHSVSARGIEPDAVREQEARANEMVRDAMLEAGIDRRFADRATVEAGHGMWYPSHDELRAAGVITGIAPPGRFAALPRLAAGR